MGRIRTGHFQADGGAYDLILGFVPSYFKAINMNAADDEVHSLEWFNEMGDAKEIWKYVVYNDGGSSAYTWVKKSSGGYVSELDLNVIPGGRKICTFANGTEIVTCTDAGGHGFADGEAVRLSLDASGVIPTGLAVGTTYYVKYLTATTFQLAATKGGAAIDFTDDGTATIFAASVDNLKPAVGGGKGVTIAATFMDDDDEIYYVAILSDQDVDHGDIA